MSPESNSEEKARNYHPQYDDDTIVAMKEYFKLEDQDELLKFIKKHKAPIDSAIS